MAVTGPERGTLWCDGPGPGRSPEPPGGRTGRTGRVGFREWYPDRVARATRKACGR
ncbi:hypothetical protein [Kitasatospora sp. NPDC008115]|uniref:hypothetical protein n=1 Tax=Kitasatospora sp. NPDC008115 TaxID=3364022 RepID=UPI0036E4B9C3